MIKNTLRFIGKDFDILLEQKEDGALSATIEEEQLNAVVQWVDEHTFFIIYEGRNYLVHFVTTDDMIHVFVNGEQYSFQRIEESDSEYRKDAISLTETGNFVGAPMPGRILKLHVKEGQEIQKGAPLFIVEAMKMENEVKSPNSGKIVKVNFAENDTVSVGQPVIEFKEL